MEIWKIWKYMNKNFKKLPKFYLWVITNMNNFMDFHPDLI